MTKAEIVANISDKLGIEKVDVQLTVESLMKEIIDSLENGENVYLRGFGSFIVKKRAEKTARNIKKNTTIKIPAHNIPAFKPSKFFVDGVKFGYIWPLCFRYLCFFTSDQNLLGLFKN